VHPERKRGAGHSAPLNIVHTSQPSPPPLKNQDETAVFDELRHTYRDLEAHPDDHFKYIAFLKARTAWRQFTSFARPRRGPPAPRLQEGRP
jgi:hypothetical protein